MLELKSISDLVAKTLGNVETTTRKTDFDAGLYEDVGQLQVTDAKTVTETAPSSPLVDA